MSYVHQAVLESSIKFLFPAEKISTNVIYPNNNTAYPALYWEVDVALPHIKLYIEFQDVYHYATMWYATSLSELKTRDDAKNEQFHMQGSTLVQVPCWWDGSNESLVASLLFQRPDLATQLGPSTAVEISLSPPQNLFKGTVPGVGELMLATNTELDAVRVSVRHPWWMGEKYDGIRSCWNPMHSQLYARHGHLVFLPPCLRRSLPRSIFIDGEIWAGRGGFTDTQNTIAISNFINWSMIRIVMFDVPDVKRFSPFEERYAQLINGTQNDHLFLILALRRRTTTKLQILEFFDNILKGEGEGIILRQPASSYQNGRSPFLVKVKDGGDEIEALATDVLTDGSVQLKLADGFVFVVPPQHIDTREAVRPGDVITITSEQHFRHTTIRSLRLPRIYRIRRDLSWNDVLRDFSEDGIPRTTSPESRPKRNFWSYEKSKFRRQIFEEFARIQNFDPLVAVNWYQHLPKEFKLMKDNFPKENYIRTLIESFPEMKLDPLKFNYTLETTIYKKRRILSEFAWEKGFDALVAENWYQYAGRELIAFKGMYTILKCNPGNLSKLLSTVFPELNVDPSRFLFSGGKHWESAANRRSFFMEFAKTNHFDPLVPSNWYSITDESVYSVQGAQRITRYHSNSVANALVELLPELELDISKFRFAALPHPRDDPTGKWSRSKDRRMFFEEFARHHTFDFSAAENWYTVNSSQIRNYKEGSSVLAHHTGLIEALVHLFPEVSFVRSKFLLGMNDLSASERLEVLNDYARERQFDPLVATYWYDEVTYLHRQKDIRLMARRYYNRNLVKMLMQLYPNIGLQQSEFAYFCPSQRRILFERIAKEKGFDPLVPDNWYSVKFSFFSRHQEAGYVLSFYYGMSLRRAISQLFPNIGLPYNRFQSDARRRRGRGPA